ncbi:MAG: DUF192 domain-containing protein [Phycisphaerae bacterium]|nr:DUF192 domain-containing protein [Phycisphaerae bacterium]
MMAQWAVIVVVAAAIAARAVADAPPAASQPELTAAECEQLLNTAIGQVEAHHAIAETYIVAAIQSLSANGPGMRKYLISVTQKAGDKPGNVWPKWAVVCGTLGAMGGDDARAALRVLADNPIAPEHARDFAKRTLAGKWPPAAATQPDKPPGTSVRISRQTITVSLAIDGPSRTTGLAGKGRPAEQTGMLFVFPGVQGGLGFWMKGCTADLDVAFIGADRRIVTIHTMKAEPLDRQAGLLAVYRSSGPAQYALELGAGECKRLGIRVGDAVEFSAAVEQAAKRAK